MMLHSSYQSSSNFEIMDFEHQEDIFFMLLHYHDYNNAAKVQIKFKHFYKINYSQSQFNFLNI